MSGFSNILLLPIMARPVFVLYGSQTGNGQSIAEEIHDKLEALQIDSCCLPLNDIANVTLRESARAAIIGSRNMHDTNAKHDLSPLFCVNNEVPCFVVVSVFYHWEWGLTRQCR